MLTKSRLSGKVRQNKLECVIDKKDRREQKMRISTLTFTSHERPKYPGQFISYLILEPWWGLMLLQLRMRFDELIVISGQKLKCLGIVPAYMGNRRTSTDYIIGRLSVWQRFLCFITWRPLRFVEVSATPSFIVVLTKQSIKIFRLPNYTTTPFLERTILLEKCNRKVSAGTVALAMVNVFNRYGDTSSDFFPEQIEKEIAALIH